MAFSLPQEGQMGACQSAHTVARNSPQVARIISPPVTDTTWPQTGQVLAGATRRRRHSLPQPIVPDGPHNKTCSEGDNLNQHMNLDSSAHKTYFHVTNPPVHNAFRNSSGSCRQRMSTVPPQSTVNMSSTQSRTLNGITMELDFEPPSSVQQMSFGSSFEEGIPFTRPPQLTLHSPTTDGKSKGSHSFGKSHWSSMAARKTARMCDFSTQPCRQHHYHERRATQIQRMHIGGKRHLTDLDPGDDVDSDGYYTSSGPACKQFINEERMAARMNNLNISGNNSAPDSAFSLLWQAAPAHNSQKFDCQRGRKLPTFAELESRLSDSSEEESSAEFRLEYAPELRKALRKKHGPLPEVLTRQMNPNCMQLVLWQPPSAILEEKVKTTPSRDTNSLSTNITNSDSAEATMDCAMESTSLPTPPNNGSPLQRSGCPGTGWGLPHLNPLSRGSSVPRSESPGTSWGANVQLFDSMDDDDMDL